MEQTGASEEHFVAVPVGEEILTVRSTCANKLDAFINVSPPVTRDLESSHFRKMRESQEQVFTCANKLDAFTKKMEQTGACEEHSLPFVALPVEEEILPMRENREVLELEAPNLSPTVTCANKLDTSNEVFRPVSGVLDSSHFRQKMETGGVSVASNMAQKHPTQDTVMMGFTGFHLSSHNFCCIFKAPERLLELNQKAYTPRVVSIGPIHHGKKKLQAMEDHKRMYLQEFLHLSRVSVEVFDQLITDHERRLRNCYAETFQLRSKRFKKMMLMDAAFVIMVFLKAASELFRNKIDRIFYPPWKIREVLCDLFLLENQLPFFILDELLKLSNAVNTSMTVLTHLVSKRLWGSWVTEDIPEEIHSSEIKHFLDFLRIYQKPSVQRQSTKDKTLSAPSVKELQQAGVKFEWRPSKKLLDIAFEKNNGRLVFPRFKLDDRTEILFRNLQAFEQCHGGDYLNDYIRLMGLLVNSAKDVEILVQNGIIDNWLPNNEAVSTFFYNLRKENQLDPDKFLFANLIEDLDGYCKRRWNRWKVNLKENYFNTPWAAISVSGAVFLLILTVIQSVCSIIQVFQK